MQWKAPAKDCFNSHIYHVNILKSGQGQTRNTIMVDFCKVRAGKQIGFFAWI